MRQAIIPAAGISFLAAVIYYLTSAPGVTYIDSGELAADCATLGIAHPTGYPLYICLGRLAVFISGLTAIRSCNLLSVLIAAAAAGCLHFLINRMIQGKSGLHFRIAAVAAALSISLTPVWWSQGVTNEVYGLTLLLNLLTLFFAASFVERKKVTHLNGLFYFWGLSLGSHLSSIFLLPAIVYALWSGGAFSRENRKRILISSLFGALAFTTYLYLPIRSVHKPFLNWSNPATWQGFINHISGWQYRVWMFNSIDHMAKGVTYFGKLIFEQIGPVGLLLAAVGAIGSFRKNRRIAIVAVLIIAADVLYSSNYEIIDIDSYYLLAFAAFAILIAYGIAVMAEMVGRLFSGNPARIVHLGMALLIGSAMCIWGFISGVRNQDRSGDRLAESGVNNILDSCPEQAVVFIENWDIYSPWLYYRYIENKRPDVVLIDKELLRRSWYIDFLFRYHPDIMANCRKQADKFLQLLKPFESGGRYDGTALTNSLVALIKAVIESNKAKRPIYTNFIGGQFFEFQKVYLPAGSLFLLADSVRYIPSDTSVIDISAWEDGSQLVDKRAKIVLGQIQRVVNSRVIYCRSLDRQAESAAWLRLAERIQAILMK